MPYLSCLQKNDDFKEIFVKIRTFDTSFYLLGEEVFYMIQITLNNVTYSITESSNGTNRTLIDILKDIIMSYLLEDEEFYGTMKLSQGSFGWR